MSPSYKSTNTRLSAKTSNRRVISVLWLAPTFNHYKYRFLHHLAREADIELTVLAGSGRSGKGDGHFDNSNEYKVINTNIPKSVFGYSSRVRRLLSEKFSDYDWVLIPAERKNLLLLLFAQLLRNKAQKKSQKTSIFTYNHPTIGKKTDLTLINFYFTRWFFDKYDRVIFYSEASWRWAVSKKLLTKSNGSWANNTIDEIEISRYYSFHYPPCHEPAILFIGRLIPTKKVEELLRYFYSVKNHLNRQGLPVHLEVIGDGPQAKIINAASARDNDIHWYGAVTDEEEISKIISRCSIVFIPGASGLSINHAFAYGRPYVTLAANNHGPELNYLQNEKNGLILNGRFDENVAKIEDLLTCRSKLIEFCDNALETSKSLSIKNWVDQIKNALNEE